MLQKFVLVLAVVFLKGVASQPVSLEGRFLPLDGNQNPLVSPTAVSWPASQISASFAGSTTVTAVIKDATYSTESQIGLLPAGVQLLVNGAGTATMTQTGDTFYFTIANLPLTTATVTLTKEDECDVGALSLSPSTKPALQDLPPQIKLSRTLLRFLKSAECLCRQL